MPVDRPLGRCPICGRAVRGWYPRGGDRSAVRIPRHRDGDGEECGANSLCNEVFPTEVPDVR
jgi:hypothetical protein